MPKIQLLLTAPLSRGESEVVSEVPATPAGDQEPIAARAVPASLTAPPGPDPIKVKKEAAALTKALKSYNLSSLRFVAYSLGLDMSGPNEKSYYAAKLTDWVSLIVSSSFSASHVFPTAASDKTPRQPPLCFPGHRRH